MVRPENVEAVRAAIEHVYRTCGDTKPSKADIVAAAGVAHKTFYRVLADHPGIKRQLELADAILDRRPSGDERATEHDPLKRDPAAAIEELLDTITKLTCVIESQRIRIADLEQQLGIQPVAFEPDTDQPRLAHRHLR